MSCGVVATITLLTLCAIPRSGCLGSTVGGDARARGVLQHDLAWARDPAFGEMLPAQLKKPWANLCEMGDKPIEYSQSDI